MKRQRTYRFLWMMSLLIGVLFLTSCEKESEREDFELDLKTRYAGLTIGQEKVFRVDSILFKLGVGGLEKDTVRYLFTESIRDTFSTPDGVLHYVIDRDVRQAGEGSPFSLVSYTQSLQNNTLRHSEDNKSFISLVFPPVMNTRWDGLALFNASEYVVEILNEPIRKYKDWTDFRIIEVDGTYEEMGLSLDQIITVLRVDAENAIERRYSLERFAPNLGLIYKEEMILDTQNITDDPWEVKAERGYMLRQYLISY